MRRAALLFVSAALLAGCARHTPAGLVRSGGSPTTTPIATSTAPADITATELPNDYVHFPVASEDLRHVVNVHGNELAAIADEGAFFGEAYPAISRDDGASWTIAGPRFSRAGGNAAMPADRISITDDHTIVVWGLHGSFVRVLPPTSTHWYDVRFAQPVTALTVQHRSVTVRLPDPAARYVSTDDGRTWRPATTSS